MASAPTSTDIASSLRTRIEELREELAAYQARRDELDRLERALEALEPDETDAGGRDG
jgi:cell shape-determining protein MreC